MNAKEIDTKNRILNIANELFAKNGYSGTSIRELAKLASVNIAAINYHFQNKTNLYCEVFKKNHQMMEESILEIGKDSNLSTQEFTVKVYEFFTKNHQSLMNNFKIFLDQDVDLPENFFDEVLDGKTDEFGPPGHEAFLARITSEVGEKIPYFGRYWAMKMIFSNIIHTSICMGTPFFKNKCSNLSMYTPEAINFSITSHVEAILSYLVNHKKKWQV
jgi:AcrR family transcriptional regulator